MFHCLIKLAARLTSFKEKCHKAFIIRKCNNATMWDTAQGDRYSSAVLSGGHIRSVKAN